MSELITDISWTQFKTLKASELKELKSFAVTSDGEHLCTVIIPQTDFVQNQAENIAQLSNSVGGIDPKDFILKLAGG